MIEGRSGSEVWLISICVTALPHLSQALKHGRGSVEVSSSQMKIDFFTTNGLFIFSQQQHSFFHSSRVVQDSRHFFLETTKFLRTSLWRLSLLRLASIQMLAG